MKRIRSLLFLALALGIGLYSLPSAALQFNYSTRLTLTDCDTADESGFNTGMTALCYDLTAQRDEIWNGSAWVAYLGAGSSSSSPAYVTPVDAGGTSMAVDRSSTPAADVPGFMPWALRDDALATLAEDDGEATPLRVDSQGKLWTSSVNYVSENNTSGTSTNVSATALGVGGAGVELIDGYDLGAIAATYCTLAITNSADGAIDAAKIYLLPSGETNLTAPNVLGGSTGVTSAHFTAPAVGSPLEWATTWVTSTGVIGDGDLTDLAASSVWVGRLKVAGADKLYVEISGDGAVDTTYRLSCN